MSKYDIQILKATAKGQWRQVLMSVGGVDGEILDGRHHPCPKCGGTDRFRMLAEEDGALFCNQCFDKDNGDGISAIAWLLGIGIGDAIEKIADYLGVKPNASAKAAKNDPSKDLEFKEWTSNLFPLFNQRRPGTSEEALLACGAQLARYKNSSVYALPIIGESLDADSPVGYAMLEAMGGTLPKYDRKGNHLGDVKVKIAYGSKPGFIGKHAIERLKVEGLVEIIWKVEGVTDALALFTIIPPDQRDRHIVLTNANGASESPKWMANAIARAKPHVLHDADEPGQTGAQEWIKQINKQGVDARLVELPYEVASTKGKDLRDWIAEGHTYDDLLALAGRSTLYQAKKSEQIESNADEQFPTQEMIIKKLQLEVLYESEDGSVRVFSTLLRKSTTLKNLSKLSEVDIIQAAGGPAMGLISGDPDGVSTFSVADIRKAIAILASVRRGKHDEKGIGVWLGTNENGSKTDTIVLANNTEAARWNGDKVLRRVIHPRLDGLVLDFGSDNEDWFDFDEIERYVNKAENDQAWRKEVLEKAIALFARWRWRSEYDPELITGLVMATWVQTIWAWRPLVSVTGESNCGKSTLFEVLSGKGGQLGMFGNLAFASAKSSEAGVRQGVGNTAKVMFLDEFERSKDRAAILQTLRASSRGDSVVKGSTGHKSKVFRLQHIAWSAAIESGLNNQPDVTRFIQFELLPAKKGMQGKLIPPSGHELAELGQKLLAIAVVTATKARKLAVSLKSTEVEGVASRLVETYAVPVSMLTEANGLDEDQAREFLKLILGDSVQQDDESDQTDQERLLETILSSDVRCRAGNTYSIAQLLERYRDRHTGYEFGEHQKDLERSGVGFGENAAYKVEIRIHKSSVCSKLLKNTEWENARIDQLLLRMAGACRKTVRMSGRPIRVVAVPIDEAGLSESASALP